MSTERAKTISWPLVVLVVVVFWPIIALVLFIYLGNLLRDFLGDIHELSFKVGILDFAAKKAETDFFLEHDKGKAENDSIVSQTDSKRKHQALEGSHVLWVDDIPSNNRGERSIFEEMGIRFTTSISTEDALEKVRSGEYDAIISDMGRPPDDRAGYTLLKRLHERGINIPFIIYSGSNRPEHKAEAIRNGAIGATNNLRELVELVKTALLNSL